MESPIIRHWHKPQPRSCSFSQQLPRHEIAVVLHYGEENHVSFADKFSTPSLRDKIYTFGGPAREDDLVSTSRADVFRHTTPRVFVSFRCARTKSVQSTVDICVVVFVKIAKRFNNRARLLRTRSAVEVDQRMPVRLLAQDWEILAKSAPVHLARDGLMHAIICYRSGSAPVHSQRTAKR